MSLEASSQRKSPCQGQGRGQESLRTCAPTGVNSLTAAAIAISQHDQQQQPQLPPSLSTSSLSSSQMVADLSSTLARTSYSGIDKLLLASMVEDTSLSSSLSNSVANGASLPTYSTTSAATSASAIQQHQSQNPMSISMSHMFTGASPHQQQLFITPTAQVPYIPVGRGIGGVGANPTYTTNSMLTTSTTTRDSMINIPTPRNKSELELYKLLEKANLLNYFGTFLSCGGDDVQQLSDADEEEFLEIMTLIGMTQKPLHVRRLQRALYEWREGRGDIFESPYKRPNTSMMMSGAGPQGGNTFHYISRHHNHNHQQQQSPHLRSLNHPPHHQYHCSSAHNNNNNNHLNHYNGNYTTDNERNQSRSSTTIMVESPAPTPNSISSSQALTTGDLNTTTSAMSVVQPQYSSPHEVLIGAPKRPRLMDSIKPRDLTKLITVDDSDEDKLAKDTSNP